jgi:hypothetical protein
LFGGWTEALDFVGTEDARSLGMARGTLDAGEEGFGLASEEGAVEGAERVDDDVDGGGGELALVDEVE